MCNGPAGTFTEVTNSGETVWKYISPINGMGIISQNSPANQNLVFRCTYYPYDYAGFSGHSITSGDIIENQNDVSATCELTSGLVTINPDFNVSIFPNPSSDFMAVQLQGLLTEKVDVKLFDQSGKMLKETSIQPGSTLCYLDTQTLYSGTYLVTYFISGRLVGSDQVVLVK